jgi:hypothetical protein
MSFCDTKGLIEAWSQTQYLSLAKFFFWQKVTVGVGINTTQREVSTSHQKLI